MGLKTGWMGKIRRAWAEGALWSKGRNRLRRSLWGPVELYVLICRRYRRLTRDDRRLSVAQGFVDHRTHPDCRHASSAHLQRIIAAYQAAKTAQAGVAGPFEIRGLWAEWIDDNYGPLIASLTKGDETRLRALLENFNREQFAVGLGASYESVSRYRGLRTWRYYMRAVWCDYRNKLAAVDSALNAVRFPLIGNPAGIRLNGDVIQIDTFRHVYHALEMREWLKGLGRATVVEIGGGAGGQACQTLRLAPAQVGKYVIFDIPEVAAISGYFLLTAFPEKQIRLYGEGPVSVAAEEDYELAVFPHFALSDLPPDSVDLYHNSCSFSEMDQATAREYLRIIETTCRRYFAHINHDLNFAFPNPDGTTSTNIPGSALLPDGTRFKRIFKKPRVFELPEDEVARAIAYEYLYERITQPLPQTAERTAGRFP